MPKLTPSQEDSVDHNLSQRYTSRKPCRLVIDCKITRPYLNWWLQLLQWQFHNNSGFLNNRSYPSLSDAQGALTFSVILQSIVELHLWSIWDQYLYVMVYIVRPVCFVLEMGKGHQGIYEEIVNFHWIAFQGHQGNNQAAWRQSPLLPPCEVSGLQCAVAQSAANQSRPLISPNSA